MERGDPRGGEALVCRPLRPGRPPSPAAYPSPRESGQDLEQDGRQDVRRGPERALQEAEPGSAGACGAYALSAPRAGTAAAARPLARARLPALRARRNLGPAASSRRSPPRAPEPLTHGSARRGPPTFARHHRCRRGRAGRARRSQRAEPAPDPPASPRRLGWRARPGPGAGPAAGSVRRPQSTSAYLGAALGGGLFIHDRIYCSGQPSKQGLLALYA